MTDCRHQNLILLVNSAGKLRCSHCHLTIDANELDERFCPECWAVKGLRNEDFEEITTDNEGKVQYCFENCGITIVIEER